MSSLLADHPIGTQLRVHGYKQTTSYTEELQKLGLVVGTEFTLVRQAPLGDPVEIRLRGFSLAIRPSESQDLEVQVVSNQELTPRTK